MLCCRAPRKLQGSSSLLSRHDLAPRAGDTSGKPCAPWLPEDPHDRRPPSAASSSPADRAPPRPALRPPLAGTAPGRDASSRSLPRREDPAGSGVRCLPPELPGAADLGRPTRQSRVPSTQSRSPSLFPQASVIFPFPPLAGPVWGWRFLLRRPAPGAPCRQPCCGPQPPHQQPRLGLPLRASWKSIRCSSGGENLLRNWVPLRVGQRSCDTDGGISQNLRGGDLTSYLFLCLLC